LETEVLSGRTRFLGRNLSERTIKAPIAHGIDYPERLLFMDRMSIFRIDGIGKASLAEIDAYRSLFAEEA
jgi:hypothetical protein